jgi:hypothetical protein
MKRLCLPVLACVLAGCGHTPLANKRCWPGPDDQVGFVPPLVRTSDGETVPLTLDDTNRCNAEIFRQRNVAFVVPAESAGPFEKTVTRTKFPRRQTLLRTAGLELELKLGKDIPAPENSGIWRTTSRYTLKNAAGRMLVEAESLQAMADYDDPAAGISVFPDAAARTLLIMEHRHGSLPRYILFTASAGDAATVRCVEVPLREEADYSLMHLALPNILGIRDGKVFLREDGATYAFPLDGLEEVTKLEFSIG